MQAVVPSKHSITASPHRAFNTRLIYNPHAGKKRNLSPTTTIPSLEEIQELLVQYQLPVDLTPTQKPGHATELAQESIRLGYQMVIAAGGDGTISEVAAGLINSNVVLGILPLGSMMNTAWMLSIPTELEKAIAIVKIGRTRKIDVGVITHLNGEKLSTPQYFIENAGIGLEAQMQTHIRQLEQGNLKALWSLVRIFFDYYNYKTTLTFNRQTVSVRSPLIEISNGPRTAAALTMAPKAKLNDHKLTISIFKMSPLEIVRYFLHSKLRGQVKDSHITRYITRRVAIHTGRPRLFHADARIFGYTPVQLKILPNALTVVTGFPKVGESALEKRTWLDP